MFKVVLVSILISGINLTNTFAACNSNSKADELLNNMVKNYQVLLKYKDKGTVSTKISGINNKIKFETYYEEPDKFTFQWAEENPYTKERNLNKLWGENQIVFYLRSYKKTPEKMEINNALSAAAGVSDGASYRILPWLLLNRDPCHSIGRRKNKIIGEVVYLKTPTYIIEQRLNQDHFDKIWVSKKSLILRKIESHSAYKNKSHISVTQFESVEYK